MDEDLNVTIIINKTEPLPWLYDIDPGDTNWIITSSFMIFTMQTGTFKKNIFCAIVYVLNYYLKGSGCWNQDVFPLKTKLI